MHNKKLPLVLATLSLLWLVATVVIAGLFYPDYSHQSQMMSALGATGAPHAELVNYFGFIPTEVLMLAFIVVLYRQLPRSALLNVGLLMLVVYALALGAGALFNCDFGCRPESPTATHQIHMLSGAIAYLSAIVAVFLLAFATNSWSEGNWLTITGVVIGLIALVLLSQLDMNSNYAGLWQRLFELSVYLWFIILGYYLYRSE